MAEKHTPTPGPWEYDVVPTSIGRCFRIGNRAQLDTAKRPADGRRVPSYACLYDDYPGMDDNETRANAEFIVRALIAQEEAHA